MVQSLSALHAPQSVLHTSIAHVSKPSAGNTHTHTQYVIRVSDERTAGLNWTVYRRYSEFRLFRLRLEDAVKQGDMCSHCSIMSKRTCFMQFPHRRLFWNTKEKVLESRRVGLNAFLDAVAKHARTCRESMTCQTRQLMDQFLDVNDMRYTYLNVNMSDSEDDYRNKLYLNSTSSSTSSMMTPNHLFSATPTRYGTGAIRSVSYREQRTSSVDNQTQDTSDAGLPSTRLSEASTFATTRDSSLVVSNNDAGRVLTGKSSMPNLLDYGRTSRSSRSSFTDESAANRTGRLSDWENTKFQMSTGGRHSDPGANRNDLLNFANASGRRSDHRSRARKVHLSSAAKRVKKLEEQEARFSVRPAPRQKKVSALATIIEEEE